MFSFVARQAIFDENMNTVGYGFARCSETA